MDDINNYPKTSLLLYTFAPYKIVSQRIFERARKFELQKSEKEKKNFLRYIKVLCDSFEEWYLKNNKNLNIFKVDSGEINYLKDRKVQKNLRTEIENFAKKRNIKII